MYFLKYLLGAYYILSTRAVEFHESHSLSETHEESIIMKLLWEKAWHKMVSWVDWLLPPRKNECWLVVVLSKTGPFQWALLYWRYTCISPGLGCWNRGCLKKKSTRNSETLNIQLNVAFQMIIAIRSLSECSFCQNRNRKSSRGNRQLKRQRHLEVR